jgi:hypothetical protein
MKDKHGIDVVWIRRRGNQAAHVLARWAANEPNKDWTLRIFLFPPPNSFSPFGFPFLPLNQGKQKLKI